MSWPLDVVRICIELPPPAANDTGIDSNCCVPFPEKDQNVRILFKFGTLLFEKLNLLVLHKHWCILSNYIAIAKYDNNTFILILLSLVLYLTSINKIKGAEPTITPVIYRGRAEA